MANKHIENVYVMRTERTLSLDDAISWQETPCPFCGSQPLFVMAVALDGNPSLEHVQHTRWLRCPSCLRGSVIDHGVLYPVRMSLAQPRGLPAEAELMWDDVRRSIGAGAFGASVLTCRALLMNLAREHADAPTSIDSFTEAVQVLREARVLTAKLDGWAERVAPIADAAEVGFDGVDATVARDVAGFLLQVMQLAFEIEVLMDASGRPDAPV